MRYRSKIGAAVVWCAFVFSLLMTVPAAAQDQPQKANITISLSRTARDGTIFVPVRGNDDAAVGETKTHYLYTTAKGNPSGGGGQPPEAYAGQSGVRVGLAPGGATVSGGVSGGLIGGVTGGTGGTVTRTPITLSEPQYDYLWQVDTKPVSIGLDIVTFDLDWKRTDVKDGARQVAAGDHRTITLRQGERHMLDFIPCAPDARCANVFLEVQASPVEEASVAELTFAYDLWLVHQGADGVKVTRHAVVSGRQGEKLRFNFPSVSLPLDTAVAPGADSPYHLQVSGNIVGRQKPDGTIEIALQPTRKQGFMGGSVGFEEGAKTFATRIDETTSVALPVGSGRSQWPADPGFKLTSPRPGVTQARLDNGKEVVRIDLKPFFEGSMTSILVTVHREK